MAMASRNRRIASLKSTCSFCFFFFGEWPGAYNQYGIVPFPYKWILQLFCMFSFCEIENVELTIG